MSFFLSGDMYIDDQQYGSLLDRYWLASKGVALFVSEDVPLHISTENNQLCLKGLLKFKNLNWFHGFIFLIKHFRSI